jgi:hypothetical protein
VALLAWGRARWRQWSTSSSSSASIFDLLGDRKQSIKAVSIDMSGGYEKAIRHSVPDAEVRVLLVDPDHPRHHQPAVARLARSEPGEGAAADDRVALPV